MPSRRALVALVLLAACGAATGATDAPAEKPVRLPDFAVNERAFGKWGVALHFHTSLFNRSTEAGPPRSPYTVEFVVRDSPAIAPAWSSAIKSWASRDAPATRCPSAKCGNSSTRPAAACRSPCA
ncbi:hypothetical protein [Oleiharenicola sp. Vm1]|uniref:hypothetical protein n=1 Tax=Oleiharenicola sp. Vm1 TaxID=3398393 RepID=UPI0039F4CF19